MNAAQSAVRVRVPATSANLGPGFDALGLALTLHDDVDAWTCASGLSIEITGEGADLAAAEEAHLVVRAMRAAFDILGGQPSGLGLRCVNRIPHGRGLGSSAAAIVAGILAARALNPEAAGTLPDTALLGLATDLEGHPDNVAACLAGGLTIAWTADSPPHAGAQPHMVRLDPDASVRPVICVAPSAVRTTTARGLLPGEVPHQDAAANAGRSALLIAALTRQPADDPEQAATLLAATEDRLHQDYRAPAMPDTIGLLHKLRAEGIAAVVSGAGPSVLALVTGHGRSDYRHQLDRLGSIVQETGIAWQVRSLDVERQGARVLRPEPSPGN